MTDSTPHVAPRFGESAAPAATPGFGAPGIVIGLVAILAVVGGLVWSAVVGNATPATHPQLLGGSIVLGDNRPLTVINRATGQPTVQLQDVYLQVGASNYAAVQAVPLTGGTMLVNTVTGAFNLLQADNYVADTSGAGVGLGSLPGSTWAAGYAAGADAFILRSGDRSTVSLVDAGTVKAAAEDAATAPKASAAVPPLGFASLAGGVPDRPGVTVVAGRSLWTLVGTSTGCALVSISPSAGATLTHHLRATLDGCSDAAVASAGGTVGLAVPGHVTLFKAGRRVGVDVPATAGATAIVPVNGSSGTLWYLADEPSGWGVFGVGADGTLGRLRALRGISVGADPAPPVMSAGLIYTLDRRPSGRPALWVIDPARGTVGALKGVSSYPVASATEQDTFTAADVLVSGPRVVYNNPGSILAVVVFTDGSHTPVIVNKSSAVAVAPTGPAQVNSPTPGKSMPTHATSPTTQATPSKTTPPPPSVSPSVTCANTTEKPYAPTNVSVTPAAESAQVTWSYALLTDQDCEPRTWSVQVTALAGPQPVQPIQYVNNQQQLDFTGLRPSTHYDAVVTAFINKQKTASTAFSFATGAQGANAPTAVHTAVDAAGNWVVSWTPCRASSCYTPAAQWVVTASACGGSYAGVPPSMLVSGTTTTATFNAADLNRLGQSLSFGVQGISAANLRGNVTSDSACLQSWRPPQRTAISLASSGSTSAQTVTATLSVAPAVSDVDAYGSKSTEFQYKLNGVDEGAPTTATRAVIPGLAANTRYHPSVVIWPLGHTAASVTVSAPVVRQDLTWSPGLGVRGVVAVDPSSPNAGTVTAVFSGLGSGPFVTSGTLSCGSSTYTFDHLAITNGAAQLTNALNLDQTQSCTGLAATVNDTAKPNPYGTPSPQLTASSIGALPAATAYTFAASYTQRCRPRSPIARCVTLVTVLSPNQSGQTLAGANWQITASQQEQCAKTVTFPTQPPAKASIRLTDCPFTNPVTGVPLSVTVTWLYGGQPQQAVVLKPTGTSGTTTTTSSTTTTTRPPATTTTTRATTTTSSSSTTLPQSTTTGSPTTQPAAPTTQPAAPTSQPVAPTSAPAAVTAAGAHRASHAAAALVAARLSPGGPAPDGAGELSIDLLVGALVAFMAGLGLFSRLRRRRDLIAKGNP